LQNKPTSEASNSERIFATADSVHTVAFSLIMLNTDAWNDQVKKKMTLAEFSRMLRGVNAGADFPKYDLFTIFSFVYFYVDN
jgi:brefeldin A-inhibited guanine nucleotide-exchange protein